MRLDDIRHAILVWGIIPQDVIGHIRKEGRLVVVPEMRPSLAGLKYNMPLLRKENIQFTCCTDNMLGLLFYKEKIRKTLFFARQLNKEGARGMCGSIYVALLSSLHSVPLEVIEARATAPCLSDNDASTLEGRSLVQEGTREFSVEAEDELVKWEIIQWDSRGREKN